MAASQPPQMFARRTSKVLAVSRAILAAVFILAVWSDPVQPTHAMAIGYVLLSAYLVWSAALIAIAWKDWWLDFRLARMAHAIDIASFLGAVYATETGNGEFSSPFMAFVVFLLMGATQRWSWKGVAWTTVALIVANGIVGGALLSMHMDIDAYRFGRRQTYMIVLSIIILWLGGERRGMRASNRPEPSGIPGERRSFVLAGALDHIRTELHARGATLALARDEEPWIEIFCDRDGRITEERVGPADLAAHMAETWHPTLFDRKRNRRIMLPPCNSLQSSTSPFSLPLATHCGVDQGIFVNFECAGARGQLLVWGIADISSDDIAPLASLAREIGVAIDREEMAVLGQSSAVSGVRNALARDLHDSVAQFLAGTLFRLEALRRWIGEGRDPNGEIDAMKEALRREQAQLRVMMDRLRRGEEGDRRTDLADELDALLPEIANHWHITARLVIEHRPLPIPIHLAYELRQMVREAVANAVRHGACSNIEVRVHPIEAAMLRIEIADDGKGFPENAGNLRPRSISERMETLGGRIAVANNKGGVVLMLEMPMSMAA